MSPCVRTVKKTVLKNLYHCYFWPFNRMVGTTVAPSSAFETPVLMSELDTRIISDESLGQAVTF